MWDYGFQCWLVSHRWLWNYVRAVRVRIAAADPAISPPTSFPSSGIASSFPSSGIAAVITTITATAFAAATDRTLVFARG